MEQCLYVVITCRKRIEISDRKDFCGFVDNSNRAWPEVANVAGENRNCVRAGFIDHSPGFGPLGLAYHNKETS